MIKTQEEEKTFLKQHMSFLIGIFHGTGYMVSLEANKNSMLDVLENLRDDFVVIQKSKLDERIEN